MPPRDAKKPALYRLSTRIYRIIQLLVTCVLLLALFYGWRWLSDPREFPVKSVKIQASYEHVDRQTLQAQILPYLNPGFIRLNTTALEEQLLTFPWLAKVEISRIWPDTIVIKITEQQAIARWGNQSLLNTKGEIFTPPANTISANLPVLNGPVDETASMWKNYEQITQILKPLNLRVHKFDMDERLSLTLELENGTRVFLGKTDSLPRLQRFAKVYPKVFTSPSAQAEYIDLRYENGLSIKWRASQKE